MLHATYTNILKLLMFYFYKLCDAETFIASCSLIERPWVKVLDRSGNSTVPLQRAARGRSQTHRARPVSSPNSFQSLWPIVFRTCRKSNTHIQMMESAKKWRGKNATNRMYCSRQRRVLVD
jgi:hypothetical protein